MAWGEEPSALASKYRWIQPKTPRLALWWKGRRHSSMSKNEEQVVMNFTRPVFLVRANLVFVGIRYKHLGNTWGTSTRRASESFLYCRAETAPGLRIPQQSAEGTERSHLSDSRTPTGCGSHFRPTTPRHRIRLMLWISLQESIDSCLLTS